MPSATQSVLATMALTGVFARHPRLFAIVAETGVAWVPDWLDELDRLLGRSEYQAFLPKWTHEKKPSDYIREHVAFTPTHYDKPEYYIERMGVECLAFSTDMPDPECTTDAINHWKQRIGQQLSDEEFTRFLGGNVGRFLDAGA